MINIEEHYLGSVKEHKEQFLFAVDKWLISLIEENMYFLWHKCKGSGRYWVYNKNTYFEGCIDCEVRAPINVLLELRKFKSK